ncbi:MAG TPA: DUF393 domain-containing protein [Polyangia bacterium]
MSRTIAAVGARRRRRRGELLVIYDASCGGCAATVAVLRRLDLFRQLHLMPSDAAGLPAGLTSELTARTIVVLDRGRDRLLTRAPAVARILAALPFGAPLAFVLTFPGIVRLANALYDAVARHRHGLSSALGLDACRIETAPPPRRPNGHHRREQWTAPT